MKRRAIIKVSAELLKQVLRLPDSVEILSVHNSPPDQLISVFDFVVTEPAMPECKEGAVPRTVPLEEVQVDA